MLAVGAILLEKTNGSFHLLLILIFCISLLFIWFVWFEVVYSRFLIVDYFKFGGFLDNEKIQELEGERKYSQLDTEYVSNLDYRNKVNKLFKSNNSSGPEFTSNWRQTRVKIDLLLPVLFTIIWLGFLVAIVENF